MHPKTPFILGLSIVYGMTILVASIAEPWLLVAALSLCPPLIWISLSDAATRQIPDLATALVAAVGTIGLLFFTQDSRLITIAIAAVVLIAFGWASGHYWTRHGREALGLGDVKLLAAGTLVVGADRFWVLLLLASVGGIAAALIARAKRTDGIPFGPFIAYSILVTFTMSGSLL